MLRVLAHQGGWDEILFVAAPVLILAALLWKATKRANQLNADSTTEAEPDPSPSPKRPPG